MSKDDLLALLADTMYYASNQLTLPAIQESAQSLIQYTQQFQNEVIMFEDSKNVPKKQLNRCISITYHIRKLIYDNPPEIRSKELMGKYKLLGDFLLRQFKYPFTRA